MSASPGREAVRPLDADERTTLQAATLRALQSMPYLAVVLYNLRPYAVPGSGGLSVDRRWRLYIDPATFARWTPEQRATALLHEAGHLLRDHAGRATAAGATDHGRWNVAADLSINADLVGYRTDRSRLPDGYLLPEDLGQKRGRAAEQYYRTLPAADRASEPGAADGRATPGGGGQGSGASSGDSDAQGEVDEGGSAPTEPPDEPPSCGSGAGGEPKPWEIGEDPASAQASQEHADEDAGAGAGDPEGDRGVSGPEADLLRREAAQQAMAFEADGTGKLPAGMRRWAEERLAPPAVDWRRTLAATLRRAFSHTAGKVDYTYRRPSRRRLPNVILPSMHRPTPSVVTIVDTSASMRPPQLEQALAEVEGICRQGGVRGPAHRVMVADAAVHGVQQVARAADVELRGGGGTDMRRAIGAAARLRPRPDVVIVLTDGLTPWPDEAPRGITVIVVLIPAPGRRARGNATAPEWAHVIEATV